MMKTILWISLAALACPSAYAGDGFDGVRCDGDIAKALVGRRATSEPVMAIERRHKDLALKDLGASDYGTFSSIDWLICGKEFLVLEGNRTNVVHDALQIPPHSKGRPKFEGGCKRGGKPMTESVVAILRDAGGPDDLPAETAWRIDEKRIKFVALPPGDLLCPRAELGPEP